MRLKAGVGLSRWQRVDDGTFPLVEVFLEEKLILRDRLILLLFFFLLSDFFREELGRRDPSFLEKYLGLEPSIRDLKFSLDLLPHEVKLVDGLTELGADVLVLITTELFALILPEVEPIEGILEGERVCDLELFPGNDTARPNLVRFYFEAAVLVAEEVGFLGEDPGQDSHDSPTEEASICCSVAAVEKGVFLLRVAMDVAVYPDLTLLVVCEILE